MSRGENYRTVSGFLSQLGDREVAELVATAAPVGAGVGGAAAFLRIEDVPVFVKKVRLTDLELQHPRSTANLYGVPAVMQYGVGTFPSAGINAWREIAAHEMTTDWVLSGAYDGFPLMYHWRMLPAKQPMYEELADIEKAVDYWGGSDAFRQRLTGLRDATTAAVLFCEHIPTSLDATVVSDDVKGQLLDGVAFMNSHDLLHFDVHFGNILTDGKRIYFTDFGLATSSRFDLSPAERDFYQTHQTYDRAYVTSFLARWTIFQEHGVNWPDHQAFLRENPDPFTLLMTEFFDRLIGESRTTPYPAAKIAELLGEQ